jgi:hypothetical protein
MAAGAVSHNRVDPTMSVNTNVTTPEGSRRSATAQSSRGVWRTRHHI